MSEVGVHQFGDEDVVRNPIITELLKRYEDRD
jgi:phosphate starvation-inducible protein PhoH